MILSELCAADGIPKCRKVVRLQVRPDGLIDFNFVDLGRNDDVIALGLCT